MLSIQIRRSLLAGCILLTLLVGGFSSAPARAQERPIAEALIIGLSKTVQQTVEQAIPKTVGIVIHVGNRQGYGSGAIISPDGLILTCAHVIEPGQSHTVVLSNGKKYPVQVLGSNSKNDYTLIKIKTGQPLPYFKLGRSAGLRIRDWVIALGHPGGPYTDQQPAVAVGRVRGLNRKLPVGFMQKFYDQAIMHDAPIFAGNSGGPLINLEGELIGINGAIMLVNNNAYASPIDEINGEMAQLKRGEKIKGRGPSNIFEQLKVMQNMQKEMKPGDMEKLYGKSPLLRMLRGLGGGSTAKPQPKVTVSLGARLVPSGAGLVFRKVTPQGTAGLAGILDGDRLISLDSVRVNGPHDLRRALISLKEGHATIIVVRREGKQIRRLATFAVKSPDRQPMLKWALNRLGRRAALSTVAIDGGKESGYGTVIDGQHILTCDHILGQSTRRVRVTLVDGTQLVARIVGRDGKLDIALLKADLTGKRCRPVALGSDKSLRVGSWLISGGTPRGPMLVGAVSATGRTVLKQRRVGAMGLFGMFGAPNESPLRPYPLVLHHDTPLVKGQFGSGVYNVDGQLVGVNVALFHRGSSFAVPISAIKARLAALRGGLMVAQPPLWQAPQSSAGGIGDMLKRLFGGNKPKPKPRKAAPRRRARGQGFIGIEMDQQRGGGMGVWVSKVADGQPAQKAGIRVGDLITQIGDKKIRNIQQLMDVVPPMKPGTWTTVRLLRNRKVLRLKLRIGSRPGR